MIKNGLTGSELPQQFMEPKAFARRNDNDWRSMQSDNVNPDSVQRSIAISLKRIADILANTGAEDNDRGTP